MDRDIASRLALRLGVHCSHSHVHHRQVAATVTLRQQRLIFEHQLARAAIRYIIIIQISVVKRRRAHHLSQA